MNQKMDINHLILIMINRYHSNHKTNNNQKNNLIRLRNVTILKIMRQGNFNKQKITFRIIRL